MRACFRNEAANFTGRSINPKTTAVMQPLVSILIPAFNAEPWIADTIQSALSQTWSKKEIIVIDDGSTDQTLSIARRFASKVVSVVSQPNGGASASRNKAFSLSEGDYIQWLDADDLLGQDKIARQMEALERCSGNRTLISSAWGRFFYRPSKAGFTPSSLWHDLSPVEWLLRKYAEAVYMPPASWLVSRELTEAAGPWDTRLSFDDDGEYFCRLITKSDRIRFVPEAKTFYRVSGAGSMSHIGRSEKKLESLLLSMKLHIEHFRSLEDSERVRVACLKYLQWWQLPFFPERMDMLKRMEPLAAALGGELEPPRLWTWKFAWIKSLVGWRLARRIQQFVPTARTSLARSWDRALFQLECRNRTGSSPTPG
jgi:glycosyltransferase involved in cell wall biosynthesis